jgi:hypothetical protein
MIHACMCDIYDAGGACGIKNVNLPPYNGFTACGNIPIFKDGKGCGSCYEVSISLCCLLVDEACMPSFGLMDAWAAANCFT